MTASRRSATGYSLLETLVAMSIMALIAASLASGMRTTLAIADRRERAATNADLTLVRARLQGWLEGALCRGEASPELPPCRGAADRLAWTTAAERGLERVELRMVVDVKGPQLYVTTEPLRGGSPPSIRPRIARVRVDGATLSFGTAADDGWHRGPWSGPMPPLVGLDVIAGGERHCWIFRPRVR